MKWEKACKKHQEKPVKIFSRCIGCEIEYLHQRIREQEELLKRFRSRVVDESTAYGNDCRAENVRCERSE